MKIKYINHGIACRINDTIYLHKKLKKYPKLLKAILEHEQEHSFGYGWTDINLDLNGKHLQNVKKEYYKFILTTPSSLSYVLPILRYDKRTVVDPVMLFVWAITLVMLYITYRAAL